MCVKENIDVIPIHGACAVVAALSASGLDTHEFTFVGFLPKHSGTRKERLVISSNETRTQIFYVPPHKLSQFLDETTPYFGESRPCVIAREITKLHEEFWRGSLGEAKKEFLIRQPKGEITLLIEGKEETKAENPTESQLEQELAVLKLLKHKSTGEIRLVMRQSKTLKICANHFDCKAFMQKFNEVAESEVEKEVSKDASDAAGLLEKLTVEETKTEEKPVEKVKTEVEAEEKTKSEPEKADEEKKTEEVAAPST